MKPPVQYSQEGEGELSPFFDLSPSVMGVSAEAELGHHSGEMLNEGILCKSRRVIWLPLGNLLLGKEDQTKEFELKMLMSDSRTIKIKTQLS